MDIRLPIGALFTLIGLLLAGYGAATLGRPGMSPTGIPIDLVWGAILLLFGVAMLALGRRAGRSGPHP
jgi:hypothetical protein